MKVWDADTGKEMLTLKGHTLPVSRAWRSAPTANASSPASQDTDGEGLGRGHGQESSPQGAHRPVSAAWLQPRRQTHRLRQRGRDGEGLGRDTGQEVLSLKGHTHEVNSVAFSPDGKRIASAAAGTRR